jgi:DNA-binding SARP family transcriptional activator
LEIRLLGPVEVATTDGPATLRGLRQKALLARLALEPGTPIPVERLIDDLWGEQLPDRPGAALQIVVARTRAGLGSAESMLVTRPPGYVLDVPPTAVDVGRFEALLAEARSADRGGDVRAAADTLRAALALWRGPALADLIDAPFHGVASAHLNELRWSAFQRRVELDLAQGHLDGLVAELTSVLAEQPLHEGLWAALMTALYRSGRQGDALRAYHDARRVLATELGVEPGPELRRVKRLVLDHDPAARAAYLEAELAPLASYLVLCEPALFTLGSASRPLAAVRATQGRFDEAVATYENALAHNERLGARPWVAHTCAELASTLVGRRSPGDIERAAKLLGRAGRLAADLGMPVLAERVRDLGGSRG